MDLNSDFDQRVVLFARDATWSLSPAPGVERRMPDRVGGEMACATSIVRYAPGSQFDRHVHGAGEEILVLDGVFGHEHGEYPAGTYIRNPPGTSHAPYSRQGCTLFVKLWQFAADDAEAVCIDTASAAWYRACRCCRCTSTTGYSSSAVAHELCPRVWHPAFPVVAPTAYCARPCSLPRVEVALLSRQMAAQRGLCVAAQGFLVRDPEHASVTTYAPLLLGNEDEAEAFSADFRNPEMQEVIPFQRVAPKCQHLRRPAAATRGRGRSLPSSA